MLAAEQVRPGGAALWQGRGQRVRSVRWATIVGLLVVYQAVAELAFPRSLFVASPVQIVAQGWRVFQDPRVVGALGVTAAEFGLAFVLAAVTGVAAGLVLGANRVTRRVGEDVLQVLFALPQVAVYPLFLLFLGLGFTCKVAFGVTHGFFPVALSTLAGRARVEDGLPRAVRAMGGGRLAVATKAILPSMLPDVLTGLRLGASLALLGVLLAELMASSGGLGAVLSHLAGAFRPAQLYALVAAVCVFAVVVNWAMTMLQRRATRWSP